jgi:diguanylate cyclase (GGDEF)-like protein
MLMIISSVLLLAVIIIIILIERSYRISSLKKIIAAQSEELNAQKSKKEDFAVRVAQIQNDPDNILLDPLTGLLSKQAFDNQYTQLLNQSKRFSNLFAVLILDIDQFKNINKNFSRAIGDNILIKVGDRLKNTLRDVDAVSRYEGDVFIALLPNMLRPEVIVHAVERIMKAINMPFEVDGKQIEITVGIGIAIYPFDGEDKMTLHKHAQEALKKAKQNGKNLFQFYQEETQALGKRELDLKSAISSPDFLRNITLQYRPYYNTSTNEVDCVEVVALFRHSELGSISFSELARLSHYSSKMFELYEWMINTAVNKCAQATSSALKKSPLIFKFDLKQFESPRFAEKIIAMITKFEGNSNRIILELFEEGENRNLEVCRDSIEKLNAANVPLVVGILALGHFALNKLNHIHFSYLKLDEKLVQDVNKREESKIILQRILSLLDNLKISPLTAGVNTKEQQKILEGMCCSIMQGNIFKEVSLY